MGKSIIEWARDRARKRYGTLTSFRVGLMVGCTPFDVPSPHPPGSRRDRHYLEGVQIMRERSEDKRLERSDER